MRWKDQPWFAFDFEATGTDPLTDRVWQCGAALQTVRGRKPSQKSVWVNPGREYETVRRELRITPEECGLIDGADTFDRATGVHAFVDAVSTRPIVAGWNCGPGIARDAGGYDGPLFAAECERAGWPYPKRPLVDVMMLACQLLEPRPTNWQQPTVAAHLGIEFDGQAHRADADAAVSLLILERLMPLLPDALQDVYELVERACGWSWWLRETPAGLQLNCGKYRGLPLVECAQILDRNGRQGGYLHWALGLNGIPQQTRTAFEQALGGNHV